MAARNLNEVYNFVNKFLNLRSNGENATLSLQCHDGRVTINLQLHLPSSPPPTDYYQSHPPPNLRPRSRPNPSRMRRSARRAKVRAETDPKENVTEQVAAAIAVQASTNNTIDDEAEQALEDDASDSIPPTQHLSAEQAAHEAFTRNSVVGPTHTGVVDKVENGDDFKPKIESLEKPTSPSNITASLSNIASSTTTKESDQSQECCNHACYPGRGRPPDKCCYHRCRKSLDH